jgi:hypothetical protein
LSDERCPIASRYYSNRQDFRNAAFDGGTGVSAAGARDFGDRARDRVATLAKGGRAAMVGELVDAANLQADGVWVSVDASRAGVTDSLLAIALRPGTRWVQTYNAGLNNPGYQKILSAGVRLCNSDAQPRAICQGALYSCAHG